MSQENVEIGKRAIATLSRRDLGAYDDLFTPDLEWFPAGPLALQGEGYTGYRGREGLAAYGGDSRVMWEEIPRIVEQEFRDLGDCVLMLGRLEVRLRSSGVAVDGPLGIVIDFRDSKVSRMRAYHDHGAALRAAGVAD